MYSPSAIAADARDMLLFAAGPRDWSDNKKSAIARAARLVGISYSRAFNIIYGRSKRIEAAEYLTIKAKVEELRKRNEANITLAAEIRSTIAHVDGREAHRVEYLALGEGEADS